MSFNEGPACKRKAGKELMEQTHFHNKSEESAQYQRTKKGKRYALVSFRELPEYMKDNEFILNYYRVSWPLKEAFFSVFKWHNETLNIWTYVK